MVITEARVAKTAHPWRRLILDSGATYGRLCLLDGSPVLKVTRGHATGQVRVTDGAAFDPATSSLEVATAGAITRKGKLAVVSSTGPEAEPVAAASEPEPEPALATIEVEPVPELDRDSAAVAARYSGESARGHLIIASAT